MFSNNNLPKICSKFYCENCDYSTSKKSSYSDHLLSKKHNKSIICKQNLPKICQKFYCENCDKIYKDNSGLWRHKKKCIIINTPQTLLPTIEDLKSHDKQQELIEYLLKENSEFKQMMIEQTKNMVEIAKNSGNNNNNTTSNIVNNNNFNLNLFLNETCKNAMNIMDFVNQLQVGINDLEETGRLGFSEGIAKIFVNGLKQMDVSDRPIHCSDSKREIVYIKDKNQWNKESEDKTLLTNAIKHVACKNMKQISEWTKDHPEYNDSTSKQNDKYLKIVCESMSGSSKEETSKNYNKIIKSIIKETIIDKNN
jgi:hypothetical protein